jgi:hypothetical protein
MAEKLKRWDSTLNQWVDISVVNRIEIMPPQEENSPKMLSARNIGTTQTEITFDKPLLPFDANANKNAFYILAEWYWTQTVYPTISISQTSHTTVLINHTNIADIDGLVRIGYDQSQGTARGENGYLVLSHFKSYSSIFDFLVIRVRDIISTVQVSSPMINISEITATQTIINDEPDMTDMTDSVQDITLQTAIITVTTLVDSSIITTLT